MNARLVPALVGAHHRSDSPNHTLSRQKELL
jgi:hypothetical protein